MGNAELLRLLSLRNRGRMRENYIEPTMKASLIEYTIPVKPNSRMQKYRLPAKGKMHLLNQK